MRTNGRVVAPALVAAALAGAVWFVSTVAGGTNPIERLGDPDPVVREGAIDSLVRKGPSIVTMLQAELVRAKSPLVQAGIAEALRRVGMSDSDVGALADELRSSSPATRRVVVGLVAATKPALLADGLRAVLEDVGEVPDVRAAAARGLGRVGESEAARLGRVASDRDAPASVRAAALRALADTGEEGLASVEAAAKGRDVVQRDAALSALADKDVAATGTLLSLLADDAATTRAAAASAMALRGERSDLAVAALKTAVADPSASVRSAALAALVGSTKAHQATSEVVGLLSDPVATLQAQAARTLGHVIKDTSQTTLQALSALLPSPDFPVRYEAALALAEAGDGSGYPAMLADSFSTDPVTAKKAGDALATIRTKTQAGGK